MTQCERILKYMQDFGSINPHQAITDLGIMRLAARVSDLRCEGYEIERQIVKSKNRYGEPVYFAEYRLMEERKNA